MEDDSALAECIRGGDAACFEQLVRIHGGRMLATARRFVRNEADARDCVQEAFLSAFRNASRFEGRSTLGTWLHRIVVNAALGRLRAARRRPEISVEDLEPSFDDLGARIDPQLEGAPRPEKLLETDQMVARVHVCLEALPGTYREIILLRDLEEFDTAETAELLGVKLSTVKTRLHRARAALKTLLEHSDLEHTS